MNFNRQTLFALLTTSVLALSAVANTALAASASAPADASAAVANDGPAHGPELQGFDYPAPVEQFRFTSQGVPSLSVDQWYERELKTTADGIRRYEQATYYAGHWRADYEPWVQMLAGMYRGPGRQIVAWNSALLFDMIYTQPVVYELGQLQMPTLLLIGQKDTTAIGKDAAPPEVRARIGLYPALGKLAARTIPHATLVEFAELGHAPQMQDPQAFHKALLAGLAAVPANP